MFEEEKKTVVDVANEILEAKKATEDGKEAEAKGAAAESSSGKEKTEEKKETVGGAAEANAQAEEDAKILDAEDKDLDDTQKARKAELMKVKDKQASQEKLDKRFAELTGKIKDLEKNDEVNKSEIERLSKEKEELEKKLMPPEKKEAEETKKAEMERVSKYLEEDKDKPLDERREMSDDELDNWLIEEPRKAAEWIADRTLRRAAERHEYKKQKSVESFSEKLGKNALAVEERHPELNIAGRKAELKKEGKSDEEMWKVILGENDKFRIASEIMKEHPEFTKVVDGPLLMEAELNKRLAKPKEDKKPDLTADEEERLKIAREAVEKERQRLAAVDEGLNSSQGKEHEAPKTELEKMQAAIAKKAGISEDRLKKRKEIRSKQHPYAK